MKKNLVLLLMVALLSPMSFAAKSEPIPPEFPPADGPQLPEEGPEPDYVGEETYEQDPDQDEGGMIGEVFNTRNAPVKTTTRKEDRGDVIVYTITTQQTRGLEVCVTTTVTMIHKATEKVLSSNTDSACYNYNY